MSEKFERVISEELSYGTDYRWVDEDYNSKGQLFYLQVFKTLDRETGSSYLFVTLHIADQKREVFVPESFKDKVAAIKGYLVDINLIDAVRVFLEIENEIKLGGSDEN